MSNIGTTRHLATCAAVTLPVIAVMLTKLLGMGAGDVKAEENKVSESTVAGNETNSVRLIQKFGESSITAAKRAYEINENNYPHTPFYYQKQIEAAVPTENSNIPKPDPGIPNFVLTGIMGGAKTIAVINEQLCVTGQKIGDGWVVKSIDIVSECVILTGPDGRTYTLHTNNENNDNN